MQQVGVEQKYLPMVNGRAPAVWSTTLHQCWRDSLEHAVAAVPLHGGGRDPLGYTRHQVLLPREVVVLQVYNLSGNYRHRRCYLFKMSFLKTRRPGT